MPNTKSAERRMRNSARKHLHNRSILSRLRKLEKNYRQLVATGPYRFSRNPMYVAVIVMLLGWAELYGIAPLWYYLVGVAIAFHLRVVFGEEPWLARTHGPAWEAYKARTKRWL